jgi:uncharacterized protein with PIN domain
VKARLYLDEDVLPELARVLRGAGYDAVSAHEVGALGLSDQEQLAAAASQGRALLTFNFRHFIALAREWHAANWKHAGIIVSYRQFRRRELGDFRRAVLRFMNSVSAEDLEDSVFVLDSRNSD